MSERAVLQPCPFCDGPARLDSIPPDGEPDARAYTVRCDACAATGPWLASEGSAAKRWNLRIEAEKLKTAITQRNGLLRIAQKRREERDEARAILAALAAEAGEDAVAHLRSGNSAVCASGLLLARQAAHYALAIVGREDVK